MWQEPCHATRVQTCTNAILAITRLHVNTSHLEYDAAIATITKSLVRSSKFPSESSEDSHHEHVNKHHISNTTPSELLKTLNQISVELN